MSQKEEALRSQHEFDAIRALALDQLRAVEDLTAACNAALRAAAQIAETNLALTAGQVSESAERIIDEASQADLRLQMAAVIAEKLKSLPPRYRVTILESDREKREAVIERAVEVIGDRERALRWLGTPVRALDFATPISRLHDQEGQAEVLKVLTQLEHGVL